MESSKENHDQWQDHDQVELDAMNKAKAEFQGELDQRLGASVMRMDELRGAMANGNARQRSRQ